jgi:arylsulfatase A-like enzyme
MERPNILVLYTDQQRWDAVGVNGNPDIHTPNLDDLVATGVSFDHHFVQNPVCMPSRVSFLTGRYPATLGITENGVRVPRDTATLPTILGNYGYASGVIGKLHFLPHANRDHRATHPTYGFDHLEISDEPGCYEDAYRAWVRCKAPESVDRVSVGLPPAAYDWYRVMGVRDEVRHPVDGPRFDFGGPIPFPAGEQLTHTAFVAEQTIEFLARSGSRPFFCLAGFYSPHSPWVVPQRYLDLYEPAKLALPTFPATLEAERADPIFTDQGLRAARHGYYAMVSEVDHHVGHILAALQDLGLWEKTVVVFTSDHGEWLGEHMRYGKGYPGHDCVSRVPLIVRWPGQVRHPGRTITAIVEAVDVVPTLLEGVGIPIPYEVQGRSRIRELRAADSDDGESAHRAGSALTEMTGWKTLRMEGFRYVIEATGREALYDLKRDPAGYCDVSSEPCAARTLARMRRVLVQRLLDRERPMPREWAY